MKTLLARLRYFVTDAWDEWRHSPGVNLLAVATLAAALFVAGVLLLGLVNLGYHFERLRQDVRVAVYLQDDISDDERKALRERLASLEGVTGVDYVDKEEALRRFRRSFGDLAELPGELDVNPLPASLEARLRPGPEAGVVAERLVEEVGGLPGVEEVRFDQAWLERLESLLGLARLGGALLAAMVFGAVAFVMASVLRLAVYARRDEIDIMLLVGATPGFVQGPFLVAGLGQGALAALVAVALVELARRAVLARAGSGPVALLELVAGRPLPVSFSLLLLGIGLAVAVTGAYFAVRRSV